MCFLHLHHFFGALEESPLNGTTSQRRSFHKDVVLLSRQFFDLDLRDLSLFSQIGVIASDGDNRFVPAASGKFRIRCSNWSNLVLEVLS
jgi:hypothetical protein